ncbi:hypothetical protein ABZ801_18815 [Actinomadura sp. NPDC047616]
MRHLPREPAAPPAPIVVVSRSAPPTTRRCEDEGVSFLRYLRRT